MLQTLCIHSPPQVRRRCSVWSFIDHTPKSSSEEEEVPHQQLSLALPWSEHGARQGIGSLQWFSWECFPPQRALSVCKQDLKPCSLLPKTPQKTCLESSFGKGNFASSVDFHFYKSHLSLLAQTQKITLPRANLFGFFFQMPSSK